MARIAIVDDDIELADNTAMQLRRQQHEVFTLYTTEGAARKIAEDKPDLVILDVMFPDNPVAGFDLAREIRRAAAIKDLPILMLTGINQEFPMDFSGKDIDPNWLPIQDFIEKPAKVATLLRKVNRLLKKR